MTRRRSIVWVVSVGSAVAAVCTWGVVGAREAQSAQAALAEPFKGLTTNGTVQAGLFPIKASGVSTRPVRDAARGSSPRSPLNSAPRRAIRWTTTNGGSGTTCIATRGRA